MGPNTTLPDNEQQHPSREEELLKLLVLKDQEIRKLKDQVEKYKLALRRSRIANITGSGGAKEVSDTTTPIIDPSLSKRSTSQSTSFARVLFETGIDEDDDDASDQIPYISGKKETTDHESKDTLDDESNSAIQDVGEIDLNLELKGERKRRRKRTAVSSSKIDKHGEKLSYKSDDDFLNDNDDDGNDEEGGDDEDDEDIISDGLLTTLTDAAINNLSQLAALQERCESQQHSQRHNDYPQQSQSPLADQPRSTMQPQVSTSCSSGLFTSQSTSNAPLATIVSSPSTSAVCLAPIGTVQTSEDRAVSSDDSFSLHDPFSTLNIANQAALAISAAAAAVAMQGAPSSLATQSPPGNLSSNQTIQADLSSRQSLASVVAAAAVAAAANDQQQRHQMHSPVQHIQSAQQSRLISSALSSPEFYQNLQHHHRQQRSQVQQTNLPHQMSPISSLQFPPSTSITPSSSSLLAQSRRSGSNTSSSFMSPIASPNYLRKQFIPDRFPLLSPSPSMTTGSSSAASTSLAHILQQHHQSHQQRSASALPGPITSPSSTPLSSTGSTAVSPLISSKNSSQVRLNNMQIRHKFGYLGSGRGQFNSPHGFCLGLNQEIVVADTNNHRICIFDKSGTYMNQFGSPGKEEGQLWNPRKVAILHRPVGGNSNVAPLQKHNQGQIASTYSSHLASSGATQSTGLATSQFASEPLFVVCDRGAERSRMQLFTKDGVFIKKIGIHYIDIVAGLAITQNGLIIVVDSVSPTVYIINAETGTLNGWFDCSGHMKEPSDIAVKSEIPGNEYFICDFKGHCVVVFSEQGEYLRKIGQDGLTSYPNGIDISDDGDILVGDSHGNRFHVVVFDRNGNFVSQFECPHVKVSRCCGLKITREGYIVTLAKNNHHVLVLDTIHI